MLLTTVIADSGYKLEFISEKLQISLQSLKNKTNGVTEFKESEIVKLCQLLNISIEDFFNLGK